MINYGAALHARQLDMSHYDGANGHEDDAMKEAMDELTHDNPNHSYHRAYSGPFPEVVVDNARREMNIEMAARELSADPLEDPYAGLQNCGGVVPTETSIAKPIPFDEPGPANPRYRRTVVGTGAFPYDNPNDLLEVPVATATPPEKVWTLNESARTAGIQRVYLSGPMRGVADLNHPAFDAMQAAMEAEGWTVHSPAESNRKHGHTPLTPYSECIRVDVNSILDSDAICLLPGWRQSEGARFEVQVAQNLGLSFYEAVNVTYEDTQVTEWGWRPAELSEIGAEGPDQEARRLVYGDRAATYGHPRGDFECIGGIWASMVMAKVKFWAFQHDVELPEIPWFEIINDELVATMMTGLKCARQVKSPQHRDTMVDIIGYQLCQARLHEAPSEMQAWEARRDQS